MQILLFFLKLASSHFVGVCIVALPPQRFLQRKVFKISTRTSAIVLARRKEYISFGYLLIHQSCAIPNIYSSSFAVFSSSLFDSGNIVLEVGITFDFFLLSYRFF